MKYDLVGKRFGRLVVLSEAGRDSHSNVKWLCRCDCGAMATPTTANLQRGITTSCSCLRRERVAASLTKHGACGSPEYKVWGAIKTRCFNPKAVNYSYYGGRGITMCDEWRRSFAAFVADVGLRPSAAHTIERINNSRGYEPGNCTWATRTRQSRNRRSVVLSPDLAAHLRSARASGRNVKAIARSLGITQSAAQHAAIGRTWKTGDVG